MLRTWGIGIRCSAVSIRLMTINANVLDKMKIISDCMPCELTVSMRLSDSVADKKSVLQRMGAWFVSRCPVLTTVILPDVLTEVCSILTLRTQPFGKSVDYLPIIVGPARHCHTGWRILFKQMCASAAHRSQEHRPTKSGWLVCQKVLPSDDCCPA